MTSALEGSGEKYVDNGQSGGEIHHAFAKGEQVGIVVQPGQPCGFHIPAETAADVGHAVGSHRFAIAGPAQDDAPFVGSRRHGFRDRPDPGHVGDRLPGMRAEIRHLVPAVPQVIEDFLFVGKPGVIGTDGDFHGRRAFLRWLFPLRQGQRTATLVSGQLARRCW